MNTDTVVSVTCGGTCGAGCSPSSGEPSGTFSDGSGNSNYDNNEDCWWLISAPGGDISVSFSSFDTESGYDYVSIYRCDTATCDDSSEILRQAGTLSPSNVYSSSTGFLKVTFTSDGSVTRSGFTGTWSVSQTGPSFCHPCPAGEQQGGADTIDNIGLVRASAAFVVDDGYA